MYTSVEAVLDKPASPAELATEEKLVPTLLSIAKSTRQLVKIKLAEHGFHNGQDELLLALDERKSISVSELATALYVRPSTVSKMVDGLAKRDLVRRAASISDGRNTIVQITAGGIYARKVLITMRNNLEKELVSALPGDAAPVIETLETVAAKLRTRLMRLR
jgi:DNA-binding MarR family transcriptional regulator